uniref:Leucine-rich repeat and death domain-containing protein 1 n=1 Tax=Schistosoma haematobium TaxID=6185 RepID=A0A095A4G6_SCHHA
MSLNLFPICVSSFRHLSLLDISNNCLSSVPEDIVYLTSLTLLNVSKNCLVDITAICELSHLQSLDVTENKLTELPRSLWKLGRLKTFSCSFNEIICLPEEIGCLEVLTALRITNNKLSTLPRSFSNLTGLLLLQLDGNVFDHIPLQIFGCISLLELSLSHNIIEGSIPAKICSLVNLRTLNLAYNRVIDFPVELEKLESLEYLDISGNPVESSTISFGKLIQIQQLSASKCGLSFVPDDLTFNIISTLPLSICELNNLVVLELQFNKLSSLPEDFERLSNTLRQLDLGHNEFEVIPMSLFCRRSRLSYLCLDANPISEVPNEINNLKELTHLSISDCRRLKSLPEGLGSCTNLCTLEVSKNKLSSLPKTLSKLESLKYLNLSDNDFNHFPLVVCSIPRLRVLLYDQTEGRPLLPPECPDGWYQKSLLLYPEIKDSFDSEYEKFVLKSLCEILINNFPKENTHSLLQKIGFSDIMIESLEKQFPGGHNHIKRLKVAFEAWTGFTFEYENLGLNKKSRESYSGQQLSDSKDFNTSDILAQPDKKLLVQNQSLQSELCDTKESFSSNNKILKETNSNLYITSHRLLHIVHLIGLDQLHSKLMQYVLRAQQVRF